jgi:DNA mismatch repair protein MutS
MYGRYIKEYTHHAALYGANTAIFLLVGSFYELYDIPSPEGEYQTSMKRAIDILGIANVEKVGDAPGGKNGRFGGFGTAQLHKYAAMLTRENWTVVVIDQEKDEKGKVTGRSVSRILSAGTHVEASVSETLYLAGLWLDAGAWTDQRAPPQAGATAIDLTTGVVKTFEASCLGRREAWSSDTLLHFFQVHQPKELVVWWKGDGLDMPTEQTLRRILGVPTAQIHVQTTQKQGALDKSIVREDLLRRCFQPKSLLPLKEVLGLGSNAERAVAALLLFVEDHFPSAMEHLHLPVTWSPKDSVYLGNHALTQLNMITAKEDDSVLGIFMKATTPMGSRAMRQRLLYPIADSARLQRLYREVEWATMHGEFVQHLRHIKDLARLHRRIALACVTAMDVLDLDQSYQSSRRLMEMLARGPLAMAEADATAFEAMLGEFRKVFDVEKARRAGEDSFCLTEAVGPKVAAVEASLAAAHTEMAKILTELTDWVGIPGGFRMELKEASVVVAGGKGVMKILAEKMKGEHPASLKGGLVHAKKSTSSFEVPALNSLYGKILRLREDLTRTIKEELPGICDRLATPVWDALETWIAQADVSVTIARVAAERGYCKPELVEGDAASIEIEGLRHPLIESQQTRLEYVKHDVSLGVRQAGSGSPDVEQGWLVYGMNASGKSSLMKATGIAILLAQCGCYVPATRLRLCPFRSLFTRILSTDNLWAGLSSFAVEMTELAEALKRADPWSLVLGDEVCSGTESMSGMGLVGGSLQWLEKRGSRFIFATHLHGLPTAALVKTKVWHLRVRHDTATDRLIYDRTLHPGPGSSLYGLEVAKAMGIPIEVLETAHEIRRSLTGEVTAAEAPASAWNAAVQRRACEICSAPILRDLEVHHIQPRASAVGGRLADGTSMNTLRNLIVVCEKCHDAHHAGELEIGPMKQTSEGPVREVVRTAAPRPAAGGLTEQEIATVQAELLAYPALPVSRMIFDLEERHGIRITAQRLRTIRATVSVA